MFNKSHNFKNSNICDGTLYNSIDQSVCVYCAVPENIHTPPPPHERFFVFHPLPPPPQKKKKNSSLASYFASKILAFKIPLPLRISDDLPWGGYGFLSETAHWSCFLKLNFTLIFGDFPFSLNVCGRNTP